MMRILTVAFFLFGMLFGGTYDYEFKLDKNETQKLDPFMYGDFLEIIRFDKLDFSDEELDEASQKDFGHIVAKIQRYQIEYNIKVKIIGHTSIDYTLEDSKIMSQKFAGEVLKKFLDAGLSESLFAVEFRTFKDEEYVASNATNTDYSNRVMVTIYVISKKDKDSDGDGVFDSKDECPETRNGIVVDELGCPRDRDKDGVLDGADKCPNTPIQAEVDEDGCALDSDKDSVYDYIDKCPNTPDGLKVDEVGCPFHKSLRLNFEHDSSIIAQSSYGLVLEFAIFLKENPRYNVEIIGHTDSTGSSDYNQALSLKRSQALKEALVKEEIDPKRLSVFGKGESEPIMTNDTPDGRYMNRRTEIKLRY